MLVGVLRNVLVIESNWGPFVLLHRPSMSIQTSIITFTMGLSQSTPKITAQDRAILECAIFSVLLIPLVILTGLPQPQTPARQVKAVSEEGRLWTYNPLLPKLIPSDSSHP